MESIGHLNEVVNHLWRALPVADDEDLVKWLNLTSESIKLAEELIESSDLDHHRRRVCQTCLNLLLTIQCQLQHQQQGGSPGLEDELLQIEQQLQDREVKQEGLICTPAPEEDILKLDQQLQAISQSHRLSGEVREIERQLEHRGGELLQESMDDELPIVENVTSKETTPQEQQKQPSVVWSESRSAFQRCIRSGVITNLGHIDVTSFLEDARSIFEEQVAKALEELSSVSVDVTLSGLFTAIKAEELNEDVKYFNTKSSPIFASTNLKEWFNVNVQQVIDRKIEEFQERDSGWSMKSILNLSVFIKKFQPMHGGSSWFNMPDEITKKRACLNVKNNDQKCFMWSILSALHKVNRNCHPENVKKYKEFENELNFKGITFPVQIKDVPKFEKQNKVSVNVFVLKRFGEKSFTIETLHLTRDKKHDHVNLLLLQDSYPFGDSDDPEPTKYHYVWIKNLSALVRSQLTEHKGKIYICDRCLHYFHEEQLLINHEKDCSQINDCKVILPAKSDLTIKFKNFKNEERVPVVVYSDFESYLEPVDDEDDKLMQKHIAYSVGYYVKYSRSENKEDYYKSYRKVEPNDQNPAEWFVLEMKRLAVEYHNTLKADKKPMTSYDRRKFHEAKVCHICKKVCQI